MAPSNCYYWYYCLMAKLNRPPKAPLDSPREITMGTLVKKHMLTKAWERNHGEFFNGTGSNFSQIRLHLVSVIDMCWLLLMVFLFPWENLLSRIKLTWFIKNAQLQVWFHLVTCRSPLGSVTLPDLTGALPLRFTQIIGWPANLKGTSQRQVWGLLYNMVTSVNNTIV